MRIFIGRQARPGTVGLHIQARPVAAVAGLGSVPELVPGPEATAAVARIVADRRAGREPDWTAFRVAYTAQLRAVDLSPGMLLDATGQPVGADATLICTCSLEDARAGRCHRVIAADWLDRAGWEVYCDWQEERRE